MLVEKRVESLRPTSRGRSSDVRRLPASQAGERGRRLYGAAPAVCPRSLRGLLRPRRDPAGNPGRGSAAGVGKCETGQKSVGSGAKPRKLQSYCRSNALAGRWFVSTLLGSRQQALQWRFLPATEFLPPGPWQIGRGGLSGAFPVSLKPYGGRRKAELRHAILRGKPRGDRPAAHRAPRKGGLWPVPAMSCPRLQAPERLVPPA
jgi:hypothetical protein